MTTGDSPIGSNSQHRLSDQVSANTCHLSGLGCGRKTAAGLYGSSRTGSRPPEACSKHSGKPWLSQPRLADCCAILSFRSPHALAIVVSLRRHGRSSVGATLDQQGPEPPRLSESWASLPLFFDYMGVRYS